MDLVDFFKSCSLNGCPHLGKLRLLEQQPASADGTLYFTLNPRMTMEEFVEDHLDPDAQTIDDLRERMAGDELPASMDVPNNLFRTPTDPAKFREIYLAAADAVRRMPKLRVFEIWFDLQGESGFGRGEHDFRYIRGQDKWHSSSKADIDVGRGLIPMIDIDGDVLEAWRKVGHENGESVELFTRDDNLDYVAFAPVLS